MKANETIGEVFRFIGDALMVSSRVILIKKVKETKSVSGLSLQTQFIYLAAYFFRYLDLFKFSGTFSIKRSYNTVMKVMFIMYQVYVIYLMLVPYKSTYNRRHDNFNLPVIFVGCFVIAIFLKSETDRLWTYVEEYLYTSSLLLESVAILPQLVMIQEAGDCETLTSLYILLLGLYRMNYVIYFTLKAMYGTGVEMVLIITGIIQTGLYLDFFIIYYKFVMKNAGFCLEGRNRKL